MTDVEIPLGQSGLVAVIDDLVEADYRTDLVLAYAWGKHTSPRNRSVYAYRQWQDASTRRSQLLHSLLTGWPMVDHEDHDGLNNRRSNLRAATRSQNGANMRSHRGSSSQYLGVGWDKARGKWRAQVRAGGAQRYLGLYASEIDAALAYDAAALVHHGEFANLNFPDRGAS